MPHVPNRRPIRCLSLEQLERREVLSVTFVDSGQSLGDPFTSGVAIGDLDGDGDLDAFLASRERNTVLLNDGRGNFLDSGQLLGKSRSVAVALGDLDDDGDVDAFVAHFSNGNDRVWLNEGDGHFVDSGQTVGNRNGGGSTNQRAALADFDGDGDSDALVSRFGLFAESELWLNDGEANFGDGRQYRGLWWHAIGDMDGDGDLDLLADARDGYRLWLNDGAGNFAESAQTLEWEIRAIVSSVALGDLDGDGDIDAVNGCRCEEPNRERVWFNDGDGSFTDRGQAFGDGDGDGFSSPIALGDLDNDGDLDVFGTKSDDSTFYKIRLNDGTGVFPESTLDGEIESPPARIAVLGDVDHDGDLDAIVGTFAHTRVWLNQSVPNPQPGDANRNFRFNQLDIVQVLQSAKYLTGEPATWSEGDWNNDGLFNQLDIVSALATDNYLQGPLAAHAVDSLFSRPAA